MPGFLWRESVAFLQQLYRDIVGGANKGHMTVARRTINGDAAVLQSLAQGVDVVDQKGQVAEIAAAGIAFRVPVVGKFQGGAFFFFGLGFVIRGGQKKSG